MGPTDSSSFVACGQETTGQPRSELGRPLETRASTAEMPCATVGTDAGGPPRRRCDTIGPRAPPPPLLAETETVRRGPHGQSISVGNSIGIVTRRPKRASRPSQSSFWAYARFTNGGVLLVSSAPPMPTATPRGRRRHASSTLQSRGLEEYPPIAGRLLRHPVAQSSSSRKSAMSITATNDAPRERSSGYVDNGSSRADRFAWPSDHRQTGARTAPVFVTHDKSG